MARYRKKQREDNTQPAAPGIIGMLYIVNLRLTVRATREKIKHRVLLVGCEAADIDRKLRWLFDTSKYDEFSITGVEKVKEKMHILTTVITQEKPEPNAVIDRGERSELVGTPAVYSEDAKLYAVGIATKIHGVDPDHALRKVGHALISHTTGHKHGGASLSTDSVVTVEEISSGTGFASPRDVTNEVNRAHILRG